MVSSRETASRHRCEKGAGSRRLHWSCFGSKHCTWGARGGTVVQPLCQAPALFSDNGLIQHICLCLPGLSYFLGRSRGTTIPALKCSVWFHILPLPLDSLCQTLVFQGPRKGLRPRTWRYCLNKHYRGSSEQVPHGDAPLGVYTVNPLPSSWCSQVMTGFHWGCLAAPIPAAFHDSSGSRCS